MKNYQYSYTSVTDLAFGKLVRTGWLPIKNGQTISQTINQRVKQQDIASTTSNLIVVSRLTVPNNTDRKLDDKIRKYLHLTPNFLNLERKDHKFNEWTWVYIEDIINELDITYDETVLVNKAFLRKLENRIKSNKKKIIDKILNLKYHDEIILRPHQQEVVDLMLEANKPYNQLSLAPRFGKTFVVLDYASRLAERVEDLVVLVASKNLSSNTSFQEDYVKGGYVFKKDTFRLIDSSLFKDEDKILKNLSELHLEDKNIILVTDEADLASHTEISREKLDIIRNTYNIVSNIIMSGTGIYKASKIFKDFSLEDTFSYSKNYTELMESGVDVVKRNFVNVKLDMVRYNTETLNIRESLNEYKPREQLAEYLKLFIDNKEINSNLKLINSDVIMVFLTPKDNKMFNSFVEQFTLKYPELEIMGVSGGSMTNGTAQGKVRTKIHEMEEMKNYKKLVLISNGMAARSFSIPEINRVIVMKDNEISLNDYQKFARALTFTKGKEIADIIRISFEDVRLAEDIFLLESDADYNKLEGKNIVQKFLNLNSFSNVEMNGNNINTIETINSEAVGEFIDSLSEFSVNINYIASQLFGTGVIVDENIKNPKGKKSLTKSTKDNQFPNQHDEKEISKKETSEKDKESEQNLKNYISVIRTIPYISVQLGYENITDFLNTDNWDMYVDLSKENFIYNLENENFNSQIESLYRAVIQTDPEERKWMTFPS